MQGHRQFYRVLGNDRNGPDADFPSEQTDLILFPLLGRENIADMCKTSVVNLTRSSLIKSSLCSRMRFMVSV